MRLLFFIPVWKRPEITEICFMGITRLREAGTHHIEALAVISEDEMKPLCEKYGIDWVFYKNFPLGEKKNFGIQEALKREFDYLVEIGSDDILKNEFLSLYTWGTHDVFGLNDFIIMNSEDGECRRISGKNMKYGTGRAIRKECLTVKLWHDKASRGLDNSAMIAFAVNGFTTRRFSNEEPLSIDIKSEVNIWPFHKIGKRYPTDKALQGLSVGEVDLIQSLYVAA